MLTGWAEIDDSSVNHFINAMTVSLNVRHVAKKQYMYLPKCHHDIHVDLDPCDPNDSGGGDDPTDGWRVNTAHIDVSDVDQR